MTPTPVRTRFAPSPTGRLHLGNVRTAVFNWLFARRHGGAFVLRIEDTDVDRNVEGAEEALMEDLLWLGLQWDEGPDRGGPHGPYRQSERGPHYRRLAEQLVEAGSAYPCFCTEEELAAVAETVGEGDAIALRYPGTCRRLGADERARLRSEDRPSTVRFAVPEGLDDVEVIDEIRGTISFPSKDITDFVIVRSDGRPTYNFAVVVDDADMEISHVIRGAGHLSNMARQALLFDALGRERPTFAHLPTVLSPSGGKLSKRDGAASLDELRQRGVHPAAVVNYLSLLGWSHPDEAEVLAPDELASAISLDRLGASDTVWDPDKLRWMSQQHIARMDLDELVEAVGPYVERERYPLDDEGLPLVVEALRSRLEALGAIEEHLEAFCFPGADRLEAARAELRADPAAVAVVAAVARALHEIPEWTVDAVDEAVRGAGREVGVRGRELFHPVRKAIMATPSGPDLARILAGLGREVVLARLRGITEKSQV